MTDRKKPGVAFWATVVAVVVLVYVASFGPACWGYSRSPALKIWRTSDSLYHPILWLWENSPRPIADAIDWYANLGAHYNVTVIRLGRDGFMVMHGRR